MPRRRYLRTRAHRAVVRALTEIRDAAVFTQAELAKKIGRPHQSFIGKLETEQKQMTALDLRQRSFHGIAATATALTAMLPPIVHYDAGWSVKVTPATPA